MTDKLQKAVKAIKAGDRERGKRLLSSLIKSEPQNEAAWLWLSAAVDTPNQKRQCLKKVLQINPENEQAKRALSRLSQSARTTTKAKSGSKKRKKSLVPVLMLLIVLACSVLCIASRFLSTQRSSSIQHSYSIENIETRTGRLCCTACAEENQPIKLWEHPAENPTGDLVSERGRIVGYVVHNTRISVTKQAWVEGEKRFYYYVITSDQTGWVSQPFVRWGSDPCPLFD